MNISREYLPKNLVLDAVNLKRAMYKTFLLKPKPTDNEAAFRLVVDVLTELQNELHHTAPEEF